MSEQCGEFVYAHRDEQTEPSSGLLGVSRGLDNSVVYSAVRLADVLVEPVS